MIKIINDSVSVIIWHGSPLQYSCLENAMDRKAWQATVHRVTQSQTGLKWLSRHATWQGGAVVQNPPANAGDARNMSSIPGSGRSTGKANGNPLQYAYLEYPVDRGAWQDTVHRVFCSWGYKELDHTPGTIYEIKNHNWIRTCWGQREQEILLGKKNLINTNYNLVTNCRISFTSTNTVCEWWLSYVILLYHNDDWTRKWICITENYRDL